MLRSVCAPSVMSGFSWKIPKIRPRDASPWLMEVMHSPTAIMGHTSMPIYELKAMNWPTVISP